MAAQPYSVKIIDPVTLDELDIGDDVNFTSETFGLHDYPTVEAVISAGQRGAKLVDARYVPRQFTLNITIEAGADVWPVRNAAHNVARDLLIRALPPGEERIIRTQYLGTAGFWDCRAVVNNIAWQVGSRTYAASFTAPDPELVNTAVQDDTQTLPSGASPQRSFNIPVGGNVATRPQLVITPTAPKLTRWNWRRVYTVENPDNIYVRGYPVCIDIDYAALIGAGKLEAAAEDLRVIANGIMSNWWVGNFPDADGKLWVELDIPALGTVEVQVIYGNASAEEWENSYLGPLFNTSDSTNLMWRYFGRFKDVAGFASSHTWQWTEHTATAQGMQPIRSHKPPPWYAIDAGKVNAAGGEVPVAAQIQGYAGLSLHHPLGFWKYDVAGYTLLDPDNAKLVSRLRPFDGTPQVDTVLEDADTSGALTRFPAVGLDTYTLAQSYEAITFAVRSGSVHAEEAGPIGGVAECNLYIDVDKAPIVSGGVEEQIYMLEFSITNARTGDVVRLFGVITKTGGVWNSVIVDFDEQTATMAGGNFYYALSLGVPIRSDWFRLKPGDNNVTIRDEGSVGGGLEVYLEWRERRL
jgi:hypothetical protein